MIRMDIFGWAYDDVKYGVQILHNVLHNGRNLEECLPPAFNQIIIVAYQLIDNKVRTFNALKS